MTSIAFSRNSWAELERDEARFQRTLLMVALPFIVLGILIPLWELSGLKQGGGEQLSDRYAELLMQSAAQQEAPEPAPEPVVEEPAEEELPDAEPEPESAPEEEPQPETQPETKPEPQVDARQQARENVQRKFSAAFNALDSLREQDPVVTANSRPLTQASSASEEVASSSSVLTSNLSRGSGGVGSAPSRNTNPSTTGLKGRQTTQVNSGITASGGGFGADTSEAGFGGDSRLQGRSLEDIQIVMDRNKSGLYSLYNRALRRDATLQGKVVLEITIAPSGEVTRCRIVSSQLNNAELEDRIIRRVQLINFGAKDVSEMTIKYPIHFIPS